MTKPTCLLALLGVGAALAACSDRAASDGPAVVSRDSAGVQVIENRVDAAARIAFLLADQPDWIVGEEDAEAADDPRLLQGVRDAALLHDGSTLVANGGSAELLRFDAAGGFISRRGARGQGPGEFEAFSIGEIFTAADTLLVPDPMLLRVHRYDRDATFLETRRFTLTEAVARPYLRGVFADGSLLVQGAADGGRISGAPGSLTSNAFTLARYDASGAPLADLTTYEGRTRYVNEAQGTIHYPYLPMASEALFTPVGNELALLRGTTAELEYRDASGRLLRLVRWGRRPQRTSELWPEYKRRALAGLATASERTRVLYEAFYARDLPLPEFAELYTEMEADDEGRIWLMRARLPGDTLPRTWDVVDAGGYWLGIVQTPPRFSLFRIQQSAVLGLLRDSLGVERVARYPLRAAP